MAQRDPAVVVIAEIDLRPMLRAYDALIDSLSEARNVLEAQIKRIEGQSQRRASSTERGTGAP